MRLESKSINGCKVTIQAWPASLEWKVTIDGASRVFHDEQSAWAWIRSMTRDDKDLGFNLVKS